MRNRGRRGRTLRFRLTALVVLLLGLAGAVVGVASGIAVDSFLTARLDAQLTAAGSRYALALEHPESNDHDADNAETSTVGQSVGTLGARVLKGQVTAAGVVSDSGHPITVSAADKAVLSGLTANASATTLVLPDLGTYRILAAAGRDGDVLVSGLPERVVSETTRNVLLVEGAVFLVVVLLAGGAGAYAVRRSLRPLDRVTATALRVSELSLAAGEVRFPERVPVTYPHTEAGQVATAVNHMLEQVEAALRARERSEERLRGFAADASHELRTPLAVVRSHADLLAAAADDWPPAARESLEAITKGNLRMSRLVDDLLILARLDAGVPTHREPGDLSRTVLEAVSEMQAAAPDHRWQLDLPADPMVVMADPLALHQILTNLLANAVAHTPAATTVLVTLRPAGNPDSPPEDAAVELRISDDGPGFPVDLLPTVTERFVRGDSSRGSKTGNSGLGLAIVASLVNAHGGTMSVTNAEPGAVITVVLPQRPAA